MPPLSTDRAQQLSEEFVAVHKAAGDTLRANVLQILRRDSFGVLELCQILDVPQPALSHHLKILFNAGLVIKRKEGTSVYYRRTLPGTGESENEKFGQLIEQIYDTLDTLPLISSLGQKILEIHRKRAKRSERFFDEETKNNPDKFASQQALICEQSVYAESIRHILAQADIPPNRALEVGPGEGKILEILSSYFDLVLGIDSSANMLQRTQVALDFNAKNHAGKTTDNIQLQLLEFGEPCPLSNFSAIVLSMVLHHVSSPISFFQSAQRQLAVGGMLLVVELLPHDQDWVKQACGDLWMGFAPEALDEWARQSGFTKGCDQYLAQRNGFQIQICTYINNQPK